jgi:bla regulator protein blaR1
MRLLETLVETPLAQAVGWTLLYSLWEGALVSAALAAALAAMRSARARYAAACVAMLVMLGAVGFTFVHVMPEKVQIPPIGSRPDLPEWVARTHLDTAGPASLGLAAVVPWLTPLWMVGVWLFALGQVASWLSVSRLRRRGVCCAPESWQKELARLSAQLRLSRPVQLLESCLADVPMVVGHLRPVILLPIGVLAGLPAGQVETLLLHELAHIRRYDYMVNVLQRSVECLLFYHPAVWWMSHVIRAERENCCDDVVVETRGDAQEYAAALAALEQNRCSAGEPAMAATGGSLGKRVARLLYPQAASRVWTPLIAGAILIAIGAVALAARPPESSQESSSASQPYTIRKEPASYGRWLNQEVVYIITDQERARFLKLTSDEDRNHFIQQFWERRNPNPGSPGNKFKEEHYRRIAYANEHFATSGPGWKTDRGYTYITYGPPDEIGSKMYGPAPAAHIPYGIEEWKYRHVKALGDSLSVTFFDRTGKGDYEFAPASAMPRKPKSP